MYHETMSYFGTGDYYDQPLYGPIVDPNAGTFWSQLFGVPVNAAHAFYGDAVCEMLIEGQRRNAERQAIAREQLPRMIDDVASQVVGHWPASWRGPW